MSTEEAVANGVRWLNENLGHDWPEFIDREVFDLDSIRSCVLGQTFGDYLAVEGALGQPWAVGHGFLSDYNAGDINSLQVEWELYLDGYDLLADA